MKKEYMTSRQRVTETINHRVPDRMPIDMGVYTATGISAFAYANLRKHLGLPEHKPEVVDGVQVLARVEDDVLKRFHCDCMYLKPKAVRYREWTPREGYSFLVPDYYQPVANDKGEWVVERDGRRMRMPDKGFFFDGDWINMEDAWESKFFEATVREAERLYKETDYFTIFRSFYPFFHSNMDYFCDMIIDPEAIREENELLIKRELEHAEMFVEHLNGYVGAISFSGDLGGQQSPFVRPEVFEELCAPYLKRLCDFIHKYSDAKTFLHSCGSIEPLLPILISCGIDIINPVQVSAQNMDPQTLKQKYGKDIVFWGGGVDTQNIFSFKNPQEVAENVRHLTGIFKESGGYVFTPVHNIMGDVPCENIVAAYDEAYKNSFY